MAPNARLSGQKLLVIMWSEAEPNQLFLFRLKRLLCAQTTSLQRILKVTTQSLKWLQTLAILIYLLNLSLNFQKVQLPQKLT